jgi:hypothetical protein
MLVDEAQNWINHPQDDPDCHVAVGQKIMRDLMETNELLREMMQEERSHWRGQMVTVERDIAWFRWVLALTAKELAAYGLLKGITDGLKAVHHPSLGVAEGIVDILEFTDRWPD